jgi:GT2 family glycosyltransferase
VLLNDDMEIISPDWLNALMDHIRNDEVGAVGARLLYPDNRIQHVGMVVGVNETSAHMYHSYDSETSGYNGYAKIVRNYSAVTGACMATRKSLYNRVGGFDERYATDYNDTDYCLKVREAGYRIVYTPFAELYHFESQTAVRTQQNPEERALFINRWRHVIDRDPYYNPNQARDRIDFCHDPRFWPARR